MGDEIKGKKTTIIKFLGKDLEITMTDRIDPIFIMFVSQVEFIEIKHGEGALWIEHLKKNYGLKLGNQNTQKMIMEILLDNKKRKVSNAG